MYSIRRCPLLRDPKLRNLLLRGIARRVRSALADGAGTVYVALVSLMGVFLEKLDDLIGIDLGIGTLARLS